VFYSNLKMKPVLNLTKTDKSKFEFLGLRGKELGPGEGKRVGPAQLHAGAQWAA
jgi:hypothetical protein